MKISEILQQEKTTLSFEVFPPKTDSAFDSVVAATREIAALKPSFMSVTYGAGGGTSANTIALAATIRKEFGVETLAHLTCVSSDRATVQQRLREMKELGIENILALRGDLPQDGTRSEDFSHASELIDMIHQNGDFCIGGACYPEGHPEAETKAEDILMLKQKVDAGCEFLTTQMFFDNAILYNFLYRIREKGITVPVIAGIMPVTNGKQIRRIVGLSGTQLPERFRAIVDHFGDRPEAMRQAGIAYATDQIIDLIANGVRHIHVYSMNQPKIAASILNNLSEIIL